MNEALTIKTERVDDIPLLLVLEAFREIFLTILVDPHQTRRHITALSALPQRVLALLEFSLTIYSHLCGDSSESP